MGKMVKVKACLLLLVFCLVLTRAENPKKLCKYGKDTGPCKASILSWFYSTKRGFCSAFIYGGCGGNENNFPTCEECMKTCSPKSFSTWKQRCRKLTKEAKKKYGPRG
uniref:Putative tick kunitz 85 n=1 Tax=Amblyomma aureolatum TaxID=187763 RepID=A0A1E1X2H9_9ACAR